MRPILFFAIVLLFMGVLFVDILAFYWLQPITQLLVSPFLKNHVVFWFFTIGLITAILSLKVRLDRIPVRRKQLLISSLYGLGASFSRNTFLPCHSYQMGFFINTCKSGRSFVFCKKIGLTAEFENDRFF